MILKFTMSLFEDRRPHSHTNACCSVWHRLIRTCSTLFCILFMLNRKGRAKPQMLFTFTSTELQPIYNISELHVHWNFHLIHCYLLQFHGVLARLICFLFLTDLQHKSKLNKMWTGYVHRYTKYIFKYVHVNEIFIIEFSVLHCITIIIKVHINEAHEHVHNTYFTIRNRSKCNFDPFPLRVLFRLALGA